MLQTSKRPIALLLALFMCFALLSGIVLPEVAETANAVTDPYARINAVSVGGGVYAPGSNVYFVNTAWASTAPAADGEEFDVTYGDGTTWGNGVTYRLTYGTNALSSWTLVTRTLRHLDPASDNNPVFVFFPGQQYSTANADPDDGITGDGTIASVTMIDPADLSTAAEADYMNAWLLGPQAGKSPVTAKGNVTVANGRTVSNSKEFVFKSTFWTLKNGVIHADGFAGDAALKLFHGSSSTQYVSGLYLDNFYADLNTAGKTPFLALGSDNITNTVLSKFVMTNSYFVQSVQDATTQAPVVQSVYARIDNCVFKDFKVAATDQYAQNQHIKFGPPVYSAASSGAQVAFLGANAGKYEASVTNCTIYDWSSSHFIRMRYNNYNTYGENASFTFDGNVIKFSGSEPMTGAGDFIYLDAANTEVSSVAKLIVTNNDISLSKVDTDADKQEKFMACNAGTYIDMTIRDNIIRADYKKVNGSGMMVAQPFYSFNKLTDLSGNLFVDYDGNVHTARSSYLITNRSSYFHVMTDIYASDEMSGGVAEMFTVQETSGDLLVTNSRVMVQTYANAASEMETDGMIKGTVVVMPVNGVTYSTENLFVYNNKDVEFLGVYSDAACTTPVATLAKGFGTLYAKARYATANTTCTVRYTITEPDTFLIVDLDSVGTYTFNGDTYTDGAINGTAASVTFYATFSAANSANNASPNFGTNDPMSKVILLMPGNYTTLAGINRSIAIVGPKLGVNPRSIDSFAAQNGRSYTDATAEAILKTQPQMGYYNAQPDSHFYVTFAGVAANTTRALRLNNNTKTGSATYDTRFMAFINAQDYISKGTGAGNFFYQDYAQNKNNSVELYLYANRCYADCSAAQGTSASPAYTFSDGTYGSFKVNNFTNGNLGTRFCYVRPMNQKYVARRLESMYMTVENCNFQTPAVGSNYIVGFAASTNKDLDIVDNSAYTKGITINLLGNKFSNTNCDGVRLHPDLDDTINLNVKNNLFDCGTDGTGSGVYITSYYRVDGDTSRSTTVRSADISGNTFIGKAVASRCFKFGEDADRSRNTINTSDNFYYRYSGSDLVAADPNNLGATMPFIYTDSNKTYTNEDFVLAAGGFTAVEAKSRFFNWSASGTGAKTTADIAFNDAGVTLLGIYSDFDCTSPVSSVSVGETVYLKARKGTVITVQSLNYTSPWAEIGLAPANEGEPVVVPTDHTVMFVSPSTDRFASVLCDSNGVATDVAPADGDTFYIKMPTTGIIYQLVYGTNAAQITEANLRNHPTVVFCPGDYSMGTNYNGAGTGNYAVGLPNSYSFTSTQFKDWKFVGPYYGIPASNGESAALINGRSLSGAYEAKLSASFVYIMNSIIQEGGSFTMDGMNLSNNAYIATSSGTNASNMYNQNVHFSINLKNMVMGDRTNNTAFQLYSNGGSVGNTATTNNKTKAILTFNIDNCHFTWADNTNNKANLNADFVNIRHTAWINDNRADKDYTGLYVNPTNAANYANTSHKPTYVVEDNYITDTAGTLFTIAVGGSSDLSTANRAGIDIVIRNNTIVDSGISRSNNIRSALVTTYTANGNANLFGWTFTGNTVTNTTGADPAYGALLCSQTANAARSVNISDNVITGYPRPFYGITNATYENNVFFGLDGITPYVIQPRHGAALSDVALSDLDHWASDFNVTAAGGDTAAAANVTWSVNDYYALTATAAVSETASPTASNPRLTFNSANVAVEGVYTDPACNTAAVGALNAGETYYVKAVYNDTNDAFAIITLIVDQDFGATPVYTGSDYWLSEAAKNMPNGLHIAEEILVGGVKTEYVFTIGTNVFADPDDVPCASELDRTRNIHLFPKEYSDYISCGNADDRATMYNIYGAQAGVSPVTLDGNGIPTATRAAARTDDTKETIISLGICVGYQAQVTVDGVAFGGDKTNNSGMRVYETSGAYTGIDSVNYTITNCISVNAGTYNTANTFGPLSFKNMIAKNVVVTNNHIVTNSEQAGHNLMVIRGAKTMTVANNYVWDGQDASNPFVWLGTTNADNNTSAYNSINANIHHNFTNGTIPVDNLAYVDTATIAIANNKFAYNGTGNWVKQINFFCPANSIDHETFEGISISITGNTFVPASGTVANRYSAIVLNATGDHSYGSVTISGNTFDNTNGAFYAALWNFSQTPVTLSGNTFIGFKHNYATRFNAAYYAGGSVSVNYAENDLTAQNVTIASDNIFNGELASYVDATDTLGAHMAAGDSAVDEANHTAIDIGGGNAYYFEPVGNMMVKVTAGDKVYYNVAPLGTLSSFTVQLCSVDGTVVGSPYTVSIVDDVLAVSASPATSVIQDMTGETGFNPAKPYAAYFVGNISTTASFDSIVDGAADLKVLDYGMYYANIATAFDDLDAYVGNALIVGGKTVGLKKSYASNDSGLDTVYQNYSFRFKFIAPDLYRYGKMYVTYRVGDSVRTTYSDTITLHTPAAE